jgi:membrane fusion protein (multidrug efflux system)
MNHGPLTAMRWNPTPVQRAAATLVLAIGSAHVLSLTLTACGDSRSAPNAAAPARPTIVGVTTVQPERLALSTKLPGRTTAPLVAEIRPQVSGIVKERRFTEGARVRAGQVLYQIDPAS